MTICMKGVRREKVVFLFCTVHVRTYSAMPTEASHTQSEAGRGPTRITVVSRSSNNLYFSWRDFFLSTFEVQIRPRTNAKPGKPIAPAP